MVGWCYWVDPTPPQSGSEGVSLSGGVGLLRYWVFLGWGGGGRVEVEDGLTPAPRPPGWSSGDPAAGRWTSSWSPLSPWGRRRGSGRPSVTGVCGWPGGPVWGSRSPGAEPRENEAGPANDKEESERGWGQPRHPQGNRLRNFNEIEQRSNVENDEHRQKGGKFHFQLREWSLKEGWKVEGQVLVKLNTDQREVRSRVKEKDYSSVPFISSLWMTPCLSATVWIIWESNWNCVETIIRWVFWIFVVIQILK